MMLKSCFAVPISAVMSLAIVSSSSGEVSLAILAGRSASTVAGAQMSSQFFRVEFLLEPSVAGGGLRFDGGRGIGLGFHRRGHRGDRNGVLAVPELIERCRQLRHDGARRDHIQIHKIAARIEGEILVADVASAGNGERIVRDEQLVVHPVIDAPYIGRGRDEARPGRESSGGKGVENANLDIGVRT